MWEGNLWVRGLLFPIPREVATITRLHKNFLKTHSEIGRETEA